MFPAPPHPPPTENTLSSTKKYFYTTQEYLATPISQRLVLNICFCLHLLSNNVIGKKGLSDSCIITVLEEREKRKVKEEKKRKEERKENGGEHYHVGIAWPDKVQVTTGPMNAVLVPIK